MRTLAIETSCDDTSLAIVCVNNGHFEVEKILSYTQVAHQKWGGVVPELAARSHIQKIPELIDALAVDWESIDAISVTAYPGLPSALAVGVSAAYTLGAIHNKPVMEVHHIMGHVFSVLAERSIDILKLPYCCLTVSGGHNDIYLVDHVASMTGDVDGSDNGGQRHKRNHMPLGATIKVGPYHVTKLAQTADDAVGEVFDKVARMLQGPYPGGKWIDDTAQDQQIELPKQLSTPRFHDNLFSFSGLKSQVHNCIAAYKKTHCGADNNIDDVVMPDTLIKQIAYTFQDRAVKGLLKGFTQIIEEYNAEHETPIATLGIVGGVSANSRLRAVGQEELGVIMMPEKLTYCTDNAAMIGVVGLLQLGGLSL